MGKTHLAISRCSANLDTALKYARMNGWLVGMTGTDVRQESSRYYNHRLIVIARMAAAAAIPATTIAVRGIGFGRAKGGELSGGACGEISGLVSGVSEGGRADESAERVL